jgi:multidrug efflux system membrane fusion protein
VSVSPIYAEFDADEQTYLQYIRRVRNEGRVPVDLGLADEEGYSRTGVIQSVDNRVDTNSGTIRVRARFDNSDGSLIPGLYARVKVVSGDAYSALLISDTAIGTDQDKRYVYVVGSDNQVAYREIKVGDAHGNLRIVKSGIQPGDRIVVSGTQRVRPGVKVSPRIVPMIDTDAAGTPSA